MSHSRVNKSEQRPKSKKSYLNEPIEFRKVLYLRTDHHSRQDLLSNPTTPKPRLGPSESHLERLVNLDHPSIRKPNIQNNSYSQAHARRQSNMTTPMNQLSPQTLTHGPRNSCTIQESQRQVLTKSVINHQPEISKQKLAIKQQKEKIKQKVKDQLEFQIDKINDRVMKLVNRKLQITFESLHSRNKQAFQSQKEEVNSQLQQLLWKIRKLQTQGNDLTVLNQKITLIQTLMAQQTTEAELMKKYYYNLSSHKLKGKIGDFNHLKTKVGDVYKSLSENEGKLKMKTNIGFQKPLFKETTNKESYKSPNKSDYQSYRYRQKYTPLNLQPLPRSSYKRDFLVLKSLPDEKIINRDHSPYYPHSKAVIGSIYGKDYKNAKAETINHKELDAFRNKIKTLKINYMPRHKVESAGIDKDFYLEEAARSRIRSKNNSRANRVSDQELQFNKKSLLSQSKREYLGEKSFEPSRIKHQQLQSFQYKLKNLFKA